MLIRLVFFRHMLVKQKSGLHVVKLFSPQDGKPVSKVFSGTTSSTLVFALEAAMEKKSAKQASLQCKLITGAGRDRELVCELMWQIIKSTKEEKCYFYIVLYNSFPGFFYLKIRLIFQ